MSGHQQYTDYWSKQQSYRGNGGHKHPRIEHPEDWRSDRAPSTGPSYTRSPIRQSSSSRRQSPPPRSSSSRRSRSPARRSTDQVDQKARPYGASLPDSSDIVPETEELSTSSVRRESKKLAAIDQVVVPDKDHSEDNKQLIAPKSTPNHSVRPAFSPKLKENGSIKKADLSHKTPSEEDQQRVAPARNPVNLAQQSNEEEQPALAHNADRLPIRTRKRSHPDTSESELDHSPSRPSSPESDITFFNKNKQHEKMMKER
ncbi:hypothetical protein CAEBREN_09721 [Caenorhabditis brenneri]|uniref:Uncharacterized protein n=1 Tax=Caenorhabditis brenneri TaxID=135651 RepID=G0NKC8_CAEBE|nr:hypothetical protein CAEBREN_09721 [Caenorhabditis brenneri]